MRYVPTSEKPNVLTIYACMWSAEVPLKGNSGTHGRQEIFERLSNDQTEVHGSEHPCEGVFASLYNSTPVVPLVVLSDTASGDTSAIFRHRALFGRKIISSCGAWPIWDAPESDKGDKDADHT